MKRDNTFKTFHFWGGYAYNFVTELDNKPDSYRTLNGWRYCLHIPVSGNELIFEKYLRNKLEKHVIKAKKNPHSHIERYAYSPTDGYFWFDYKGDVYELFESFGLQNLHRD